MTPTTKTMTVAEALAEGYTHCGIPGETSALKLSALTPEQAASGEYAVAGEPYPYQLHDRWVAKVIEGELACQDTVADEDGILLELISTIDYSAITRALNEALSKHLWHPITDIFITQL